MGKKKAILHYLENIKSKIEDIDQPDALDRILALLIQADASTRILETEKTPREFETNDYFAPAQKNEVQLRFKKTCGNPGRKQKYIPLR